MKKETANPASQMAKMRWDRATEDQKREHSEKMNTARWGKKKKPAAKKRKKAGK